MDLGIIGLPKSGKTTIFNALTRGKAEALVTAKGEAQFNVGMARVEDTRLKTLEGIFKPKKYVPAEIKYLDVALQPVGFGKGEGFSGVVLNQLRQVDALVHVVRAFKDDSVPHILGSVDPLRDIANMNLELAFCDLAIIEKRIQKIKDSLKGARVSEREGYVKEEALLVRIKEGLENENHAWKQALTAEEKKYLENYQFLTAKPLLIVLNIGEQDASTSALEKEVEKVHGGAAAKVISICGKLEKELQELSEEDAREFRASLNLGTESGLKRLPLASYELLGFMSFFTVGEDEVRAWTITKGTVAQKAAGKVHSDIEKGFIRAEAISYKDFIECGAMAEARKKGLLRLEGKTYVVQDGDIINFLFNV